MRRHILVTSFLLVTPLPLVAQVVHKASPPAIADTTSDEDEEEGRPGVQFGVASGALRYQGGLTEQSVGAVVRWVPVRWFSLSGTPTAARLHQPATGTLSAQSAGGLTDLPIEATASHGFGGRLRPTLSAGFGLTLPVGDQARGLGSGEVGYSSSLGLGLAPTSNVWMHLGAGRSLSGLSPASAFGTGSGWSDLSAGTNLTDRLGVSGGFGTDLGAVDPTIGRSTSVNAGLSYSVSGPMTFNLGASHGLSGAAPSLGVVFGFGTAFPYLNHLGSGGSTLGTMQGSLGGGAGLPGRGRGRP